jgi:hypothetical protein
MSKGFIQIPPDSTGKKVATRELLEIGFFNLSQTEGINQSDIITGQTSNATGRITSIIKDTDILTSGSIFLDNYTGVFLNNENIVVNSQIVAQVRIQGTGEERNHQKVVLTDPDNPNQMGKLDRFGAQVTSFTDGSPIMTPFGALTVGQRQTIKDYSFPYDNEEERFYTKIEGAGATQFDAFTGTSLLTCTTTPGDLVQRTTHFYHPYSAGIGQLIYMTVRVGDRGKPGVIRRWGYYDDHNGVYWELNGTTLYTVVRSNVSGSVVERKMAQQDFSNDRLDGTNTIGFDLDVSQPNIYAIDMQWLGAGRVRFSVSEPQGNFITANVIPHANTPGTLPYIHTGTLPIRYEQLNDSLSGSTSEMRLCCVSVKHAGFTYTVGNKIGADTGFITVSDTDEEKYIGSYKPSLEINGITNRALLRFLATCYSNTSIVGDSPVIFRVYAGLAAGLTDSDFQPVPWSVCSEQDLSATGFNPVYFKQILSMVVNANGQMYQQTNISPDIHTMEIYNLADGVNQQCIVATAQLASSGQAMVCVSTNWEEILH